LFAGFADIDPTFADEAQIAVLFAAEDERLAPKELGAWVSPGPRRRQGAVRHGIGEEVELSAGEFNSFPDLILASPCEFLPGMLYLGADGSAAGHLAEVAEVSPPDVGRREQRRRVDAGHTGFEGYVDGAS
jgi:hypothetical protein